jgi:hypothetical protein
MFESVTVDPEGCQNADSSGRDPVVLVDQAAKEITPFDLQLHIAELVSLDSCGGGG